MPPPVMRRPLRALVSGVELALARILSLKNCLSYPEPGVAPLGPLISAYITLIIKI